MKFSFLPKDKSFYRLLEELALKAQETVRIFQEMILTWHPKHPGIQNLKDLEHECDRLVHEIMDKLHKTFVTPLDREDIHLLAKRIDDIPDIAQGVGERMVLFEIGNVRNDLKKMVIVLEKAVALVVAAVFKLGESKESQAVLNCCLQINALESEGDRAFEQALSSLFHENKDPLEVIKWKELYDAIEMGIDRCEDIGNILWGIVVKYG